MTLRVIGHRGAMAHKPENSLESYALAEEVGVDEIELDVRLSKDGQLFLLHDATLDRTAGDETARGLGPAADLTLAQLQAAVLDSGRGVVTLSEMYAATTSFIQLEIKDPATVSPLAEYFAAHPADGERTILTSFKPDALRHAFDLMPHIDRCVIVASLAGAERFEGGWRGMLDYARASRLACGFDGVTSEAVDAMHALDIKVHLWPCRTLSDARQAVELGADGVTSDDPGLAMAWRQQLLTEQPMWV